MITALALFMIGCADEPRAHVLVVPEAEPLPAYVTGANAWSRLGYSASFEDSGELECADVRDGLAGGPCQITIVVGRRLQLRERYGADGLADRTTRSILIDARWSSWNLIAISAHEIGHVLLDTGRHLDGQRAIMGDPSAEWDATPADYGLACETIGVCVEEPR